MLTTFSQRSNSRLAQVVEAARWQLQLPVNIRRLITAGVFESNQCDASLLWLAGDPTLSNRIVVWANSRLFNLSRELTDLGEVHALLGAGPMARLAVVAGYRDLFRPSITIDSYNRTKLWRHSLGVGTVSAMIARTCDVADTEAAFLAGVFHDVGLLASEVIDRKKFSELIFQLSGGMSLVATEKRQLGWNHQQLGHAILEQWGMPRVFCEIARYHHEPDAISNVSDRALFCCVVLADYLCNRCGWTEIGEKKHDLPPDFIYQEIGIDAICLTVLWSQLYATLEQSRTLD